MKNPVLWYVVEGLRLTIMFSRNQTSMCLESKPNAIPRLSYNGSPYSAEWTTTPLPEIQNGNKPLEMYKKRNDERKGVHFEFCSNGGIFTKLWIYVIANVLFVICSHWWRKGGAEILILGNSLISDPHAIGLGIRNFTRGQNAFQALPSESKKGGAHRRRSVENSIVLPTPTLWSVVYIV